MWPAGMRGAIVLGLAAALGLAGAAHAQKQGGTLTLTHIDSPPSPSIQEEATASVVVPFMPLFNNLVIYDQHVAQNSLESIVPELATKWSWNAEKTVLTFTLREGVRWHDGKPFTSADVKCTWDMVSPLEWRRSSREYFYSSSLPKVMA